MQKFLAIIVLATVANAQLLQASKRVRSRNAKAEKGAGAGANTHEWGRRHSARGGSGGSGMSRESGGKRAAKGDKDMTLEMLSAGLHSMSFSMSFSMDTSMSFDFEYAPYPDSGLEFDTLPEEPMIDIDVLPVEGITLDSEEDLAEGNIQNDIELDTSESVDGTFIEKKLANSASIVTSSIVGATLVYVAAIMM